MKRVLEQASCHFLVSNTVIGYAIAHMLCLWWFPESNVSFTHKETKAHNVLVSQGPQLTSSWDQYQLFLPVSKIHVPSISSSCVFCDYLHPHHISVHQRQTGDSGYLQCWKTHHVIHSRCSIEGHFRLQTDQPWVRETNPRDMVSSGYRAELRPPNTRKHKMHLLPWRPGERAGIGFIWV